MTNVVISALTVSALGYFSKSINASEVIAVVK